MMDSLHFKAHKQLYGLTGLVEFFFTAKSMLIVCNIGNNVFGSERFLLQRLGTTLKTCKVEFVEHVFPLHMKPTGQVNFAFDTGLLVCLRDDREDGELQVSFEGSLRLQLAVEGVQSLFVSGQPDTKQAFHRRFA